MRNLQVIESAADLGYWGQKDTIPRVYSLSFFAAQDLDVALVALVTAAALLGLLRLVCSMPLAFLRVSLNPSSMFLFHHSLSIPQDSLLCENPTISIYQHVAHRLWCASRGLLASSGHGRSSKIGDNSLMDPHVIEGHENDGNTPSTEPKSRTAGGDSARIPSSTRAGIPASVVEPSDSAFLNSFAAGSDKSLRQRQKFKGVF